MTFPPARQILYPATLAIGSGVLLIIPKGLAVSDPHAPCAASAGDGVHAKRTVYEGLGIEGIEFGFGTAEVEGALGPAEGGSEHHLSYASSGVKICFCGGKIKDIHLTDNFRGKLNGSGLGLGSTLDAVMAAYGEIMEEKVVDSVCGWNLDRVLLVREGADGDDDPAYKLCYYDFGVIFFFDDEELITEFVVHPKCSD